MGSYKYELVIIDEPLGHEGEYLFVGDIIEKGDKIGQYETPNYGGLPEFSFVSGTKKKEFFAYAVEGFGTDVGETDSYICGIKLIEALFDETD